MFDEPGLPHVELSTAGLIAPGGGYFCVAQGSLGNWEARLASPCILMLCRRCTFEEGTLARLDGPRHAYLCFVDGALGNCEVRRTSPPLLLLFRWCSWSCDARQASPYLLVLLRRCTWQLRGSTTLTTPTDVLKTVHLRGSTSLAMFAVVL